MPALPTVFRAKHTRSDTTPALSVTHVFGYNPRSEVTEALMGDDTYGYAYDPLGDFGCDYE